MVNLPHARLRAWITRSRRSTTEVAAGLGISAAALSHLCLGTRRPSLGLAVRIHELTGIPAKAWVSTTNANARPRKLKAAV